MEIISDITAFKESVIGLGFFDGIHKGHEILIKNVTKLAKKYKLPSILITFKKSPAEYFNKTVKYITTNEEKLDIISEFGIDYIIELPLDKKTINTSAISFLENYLIKQLNVKYIITGFNFTFGKNKEGTSSTLKNLQSKLKYNYIEIPAVKDGDNIISSTYIKELLTRGEIEKANTLLYKPFQISGIVQKGDEIGKTLGFPTANIDYNSSKISIPFGVYAVNVEYDNQIRKGIMNYGIKPTLNKHISEPTAETHIFNFDKNIYNEKIQVKILKQIRKEKKFNSINELKLQIKKDIEKC